MRFGSTIWETVRGAQNKDPEALRALVLKYRDPLELFIRTSGVPAVDAEDLCQEVFVRLLTGGILERVDPAKGKFRTLLIGVAQNVTRQWFRDRSAAKRAGTVRWEDVEEPASGKSFDTVWFSHLVTLALERLLLENPTDPSVQALDLHLRQGLDYKSIAEKLGGSIGSVSGHIFRARRKLIDVLKKEISEYALSPFDRDGDMASAAEFLRGAP